MADLTYVDDWRSIAARIRGLERAAELHSRFLAVDGKSIHGADKSLQDHCADILSAIKNFNSAFESSIPKAARGAISRFLADGGQQIENNNSGKASLVHTIVVKLSAFEAETTFYLGDTQERIRSTCELAFLHLQRLIIVDEDLRKKWQAAFRKHETHCEKLGAVHLLWHGIWAFKFDGFSGRTDLIFPEPLRFEDQPAALGFVLTEWKKAGSNPDKAYTDARKQATRYSKDVLAGVELVSHRYAVVVSEKYAAPPSDIDEDGVIYRHINIAVDPDSPSVAAKM